MKASNLRFGASAAQPAVDQSLVEEMLRGPGEGATGPADVVTDDEGRKLTLRELTLLEEADLLVAMERFAESSGASTLAFLVARVAAIDGTPLAVPTTHRLLRAAMQTVGTAGVRAIVRHFEAAAGDEGSDEDGVDMEIAAAKN